MLLFCLATLAGLGLLAVAADKFVDGASGLANSFGVSKLVIGILIVGFGTSAPELLVSGLAAMKGSPGISLGNAFGSNIANISLVIGVSALFRTLPVESAIVRREFPFLALATVVTFVLFLDGELGVMDGVILIALLLGILGALMRLSTRVSKSDPIFEELESNAEPLLSTKAALFWASLGLVGMLLGSRLLVWGASSIAADMGVSELVIGLTIVAVGTSLPELAAAIVSVRRGEGDLVIGNVIGSNLFNTLGVIGLPGLLAPCEIPSSLFWRDFPIMALLTAAFFLASMTPRGRGVISRVEGFLFLLAFAGYQLFLALGQ